MLVDVVIPAYNPGPFLEEALKSCYAQTYKNFTVTVVDDNSSENLIPVLKKFPKVNYIRNESNLGPAGSRNVAIKATKGEIISLLDADDLWTPNKLSLSVKAFKENSDLGLVCGNYKIMVNRKRLMRPFYKTPIQIDYEKLMRQNFVASGSTSFKRDAVDKVGLFNERYYISEDYDMWLRISEKYPIKYIHEVLYYYSVIPKGGSLTQRSDIQKNHLSNIQEIRERSRIRVKEGQAT